MMGPEESWMQRLEWENEKRFDEPRYEDEEIEENEEMQ
jgi:hypothetical protein